MNRASATVSSADRDAGGLVGSGGGAVTNSYWDTNTTGQLSSTGGTPLQTTNMTGSAAATTTNVVSTTDQTVVLAARTPGFSPFAVGTAGQGTSSGQPPTTTQSSTTSQTTTQPTTTTSTSKSPGFDLLTALAGLLVALGVLAIRHGG